MKSQNQPVTEHDLHAYVDNQLGEQRRREVEQWLSTHPVDAEQVRDWQQQGVDIQQLYQPSELPLVAPAGHRQLGAGWRAAAAVLLMVATASAGWLARDLQLQPASLVQQQLTAPAQYAHQMYASDPGRPVELGANRVADLQRWVSSRMQRRIVAPSLQARQFSLLGGRLLPSTNRMAVQFMYQDDAGERVTLYIRRGEWQARTPLSPQQQQGLTTLSWTQGEMGYALTGQIGAARLQQLAELVQQEPSLSTALTVAVLAQR